MAKNNLKLAFNELKTILEMVPVTQEKTFSIEAVNYGELTCFGMLDNEHMQMDQLKMGSNVETRWTFQKRDIHFMIFQGSIDLFFRLNENNHAKHLSTKQSLRIPAGIPFMLKTYESPGSVLLISIKEKQHE